MYFVYRDISRVPKSVATYHMIIMLSAGLWIMLLKIQSFNYQRVLKEKDQEIERLKKQIDKQLSQEGIA